MTSITRYRNIVLEAEINPNSVFLSNYSVPYDIMQNCITYRVFFLFYSTTTTYPEDALVCAIAFHKSRIFEN